MHPSTKHPMYGRQCPNPYNQRNAEKMKKRGARWIHISKSPVWQYDEAGREVFHHMTIGETYKR